MTAFANQFAGLVRAFHVASPFFEIQGAVYTGLSPRSQRPASIFMSLFYPLRRIISTELALSPEIIFDRSFHIYVINGELYLYGLIIYRDE